MRSASSLFFSRNGAPRSRYMLLGFALSILPARPAGAGQNAAPVLAPHSATATPQTSVAAWMAQPLTFAAQKQSLAQAVATVSKQLNCAIVVEGEPALREADFDLHGSAKDVLTAIADTFDCAWKVNKNGVILLNRRFTSRTDIPQMRLAEMTQMAADFARLLPDTGAALNQPMFLLNALYRTLTPEQLAMMQNKKHLDYTRLPREQQQLVHLAIVNNMFSDSRSRWEHLHDQLVALPRARLVRSPCIVAGVVKRDSLPPASAPSSLPKDSLVQDTDGHVWEGMVWHSERGEKLVCVWQDAQGQEQTFHLYEQAFSAAAAAPENTSPVQGDTPASRADESGRRGASVEGKTKPLEQLQLPAQAPPPAAVSVNAPAVGLNALAHLRLGSTTLEHVAAVVEEQTGVHVVVPRALRERQFVVQVDGIGVKTVLDALAELNGWRVTVYSDKAVGVSRPNAPDVQQLRDLSIALRGVLPSDFRSYLRVPAAPPPDAQTVAASHDEGWRKANERFDAGAKWNRILKQLKSDLWKSFPSEGTKPMTLTYDQLSPTQREQLVGIVTIEAISYGMLFSGRGDSVLYGEFTPAQQDETKSFLTFNGKEILVSTETNDGKSYTIQGFGEPIMSREKLPDPFHFGRK